MDLALGLDSGDRLGTPGGTEVGIERGDPLLDPPGHRPVGRIGQPQRGSRDGVPAEAEEEFELSFRNLIALHDLPAQATPAPSHRPGGVSSALRYLVSGVESERSPSLAATVRGSYLYPSPALITRTETVTRCRCEGRSLRLCLAFLAEQLHDFQWNREMR